MTQKSKEDNFIDNVKRKIQELYQTFDDSGIPSKLDSILTPKLLNYSRKQRENELQVCVFTSDRWGPIYSLSGSVKQLASVVSS